LAWINLGVIYDRLEKPDDEIRCYRKAVEINPSFWGGYMKLGLAQDKAGDHASAAKSYKRATELEPRNKHLWALLSEQYDKLGQDDLSHEAMARYRQLALDS
jgi:Flp pilus assembly protein TadD